MSTLLELGRIAWGNLEVFLPGETISANDRETLLQHANLLIGSWAQQRGTIPAVTRSVFDMTAGKGSPSNPYTIGPGGNMNVARPVAQQDIVGVGLLLTASTPDVEIQRAVYTDQQYNAIAIKDLTNALFTGAYYRPTYTGGLGSLFLWPVPDTAINDLVLYLRVGLAAFTDTSTVYTFPPGYEDALVDALTLRLATPYGATVTQEQRLRAQNSLDRIGRSNLPLSSLASGMPFWSDRGYGYNIETGE